MYCLLARHEDTEMKLKPFAHLSKFPALSLCAALGLFTVGTLTGCDKDKTPGENLDGAIKEVEEGTEDAVEGGGDLIDQASDGVKDAADATGEALEDAADATKDALNDAADATGEAVEDAGNRLQGLGE